MPGTTPLPQTQARGLVDAATFREAMAEVPGPVAVVTGVDAQGVRWGFTASSLVSVSLTPPLLLVSVAHSSSCRTPFVVGEEFMVSVLDDRHREIATRFATSGVDRFAGREFPRWRGDGPPYLPDAPAVLHCIRQQVVPAGDHDLVVGAVQEARRSPGGQVGPASLIWLRRRYRTCI
jgi:flavin reductase ActVB